ncbi:hypothetical protein HCH_06877 [Hahella chejuensis KCTC 2396]|uniref:Uncharacterized protein n=1 Tax=Hahella chejuensis (strain KCTC 2396) TaxID=349521 RepID=Q2S779_HAHCH|nr:hypothetical protein HCH_06877 [Hahella chejuensis KCTC 2396]
MSRYSREIPLENNCMFNRRITEGNLRQNIWHIIIFVGFLSVYKGLIE